MPDNRFDQVGGIIAQKGARSGGQTIDITYQTKGLKRRRGIQVELGRSHIERLKDAHREIIKRKGNV